MHIRRSVISLVFVLCLSMPLSAKGPTARIVITGADLLQPVEIPRGREGRWFHATAAWNTAVIERLARQSQN